MEGGDVRDENLVGPTSEQIGLLFVIAATASTSSHVLSDFSNRCGKVRAVFEECPHHGDCRIPIYYDGRARVIHDRNGVEAAARE
jgi:hypothetical protein